MNEKSPHKNIDIRKLLWGKSKPPSKLIKDGGLGRAAFKIRIKDVK